MGRHRSRYWLMALYFVTGNANKFAEIAAIIPDLERLTLDLDEIQSLDAKIVIEHKLSQAANVHSEAIIVEDTAVGFNCISGLPGTMIKWFLDTLGTQGLSDLVMRYQDHSAFVRTTIGYRNAAGNTHYFVGECTGTIVPPSGTSGFGFDPIFITQGQSRTNAELTREQKNTFSARGTAARALAVHLDSEDGSGRQTQA
jgi:inosine triphosphate pyrophosphatase